MLKLNRKRSKIQNLNLYQKEKLFKMLNKYKCAFIRKLEHWKTDLVESIFENLNCIPVCQKLY